MPVQKTLYILRHAKAEPLASGQDDHERQLAGRGVSESISMGRYMLNQHINPDRVICSTAVRTRQTLQHIQEAYAQTFPIHYNEKLYLTTAHEMLNVISGVPEEVSKLLVVGHNPGLHEMCLKLVKDGDNMLRRGMAAKFPTCALAEIHFDGSWQDIAKTATTLARFVTPEML